MAHYRRSLHARCAQRNEILDWTYILGTKDAAVTPIPQKTIQPPSAEREDVFSDELVIEARSFDALSNAIENPPAPTPALVELFRKK